MSYFQKGTTNQTQHSQYSKCNNNAGADKIVSFLLNDKEEETRGRTKHNHAVQQVPESGRLQAAEIFYQNLRRSSSSSEQSNRNADKMKVHGNIFKKSHILPGRNSRVDSQDQQLHKYRSVSQCSHYSSRQQSLTKPFQKNLNSKTLCYEINSMFVCQDWKKGICEQGYDCEKYHFFFLKMGQWNTELSKNPPNQPKNKPCVNKGIEIQQADPTNCVVIRTVETKLVSVMEALALFKGSGRESAYRYEISVAVVNEKAMEEFQEEVTKISHNNGNRKSKNNYMDVQRADLWKQSRIRLSAKNYEQDDSINNSYSVSESQSSQCPSQASSSNSEVIKFLVYQMQEMNEKFAELAKSTTLENQNIESQNKKQPQQQQQQQNQQLKEVQNQQPIQIISMPPRPNHGQACIPVANLNNGKQQQKQKSQKIPDANTKKSSQKQPQPKTQQKRKPDDSSEIKSNCNTQILLEKNYQVMNKLSDEKQSVFQEDQYFKIQEQELNPWFNNSGGKL